jgi:Flp pilus assembly pilin Flp
VLTIGPGVASVCRSWRGERGAALAEITIAVCLLSVALIGLAVSFPVSFRGVTGSGLQTTATGLAQEVIEEARQTAYGSLPTLAAARAAVPGFTRFDREVVVADYAPAIGCATVVIAGTTVPGCRQVTVHVYFTEQQGEVQTTLSTVIARP